ncbi:hypothetical protein CTI12_AA073480 [Artemisia annua]|uniref:Nucleoplasmin-like domain-containing protein n=1 Tax=Artemisia annua TaxID=35608 RepID=A0A2U1Q5D3_ARTAN|nr:hypothetical protein CTI12_AA073480 [Artemisia annua]
MRMELWHAEVKPNETLQVTVGDLKLLHLSGAALGEVKKRKLVKNISLKVIVDGKQLVLGTLSSKIAPQIKFNLVFEHDFELSHGWKDGSVYFSGFVADVSEYPFVVDYFINNAPIFTFVASAV